MTPNRWQQIDQLFQTAVEMNPEERKVFLDKYCGDDDDLRKEVESLLASDEQNLSLVDAPAYQIGAPLLVSEQPKLKDGEKFGAYEIFSFIASGGMGEVYLAKDERLERKIALKLLRVEFAEDENWLKRFKHEAKAVSALNHPNIVTIHEVGEIEGRHFITTEFVEGETLRQRLKRERLELPEVLDVSVQICNALSAAHQAGVVHLDIKPENIMLRHDGYVKVLDFGLSITAEHQAVTDEGVIAPRHQAETTPKQVFGTAKYMSPEQAQGFEVNASSDIFSFGVVLYEMLTGRLPFEGDNSSDIFAAIHKTTPQLLTDDSAERTDDIWRIVRKALHKNPAERYQSASEMITDLKKKQLEIERSFDKADQDITATESRLQIQNTGKIPSTSAEIPQRKTSSFKLPKNEIAIAAAVLLIATLGGIFAIYNLLNDSLRTREPIKISRIFNTGKTSKVAIAPDGKYVAHVLSAGGKQSLLIKELSTNNTLQLIAPENVAYKGLTFSKTGEYIYYVQNNTLFRIPALDGEPKKILDGVHSPVSFSPDDQKFTFVRESASKETSLILANADGNEERELAASKKPETFLTVGPAWSPDGKVIACPVMATDKPPFVTVRLIPLAGNQARELSDRKWRSIDQMAWLSDGSGLIAPAVDFGQNASQIWFFPISGAEPRRVTSDFNNYGDISLTADSKSLVTIQFESRINIWLLPQGKTEEARVLSNNVHAIYRFIAWTPDEKIIYPSQENAEGGRDIWIMNQDGSENKQLTSNARLNIQPCATGDGRYLVFSSNRVPSGVYNLWRMNMDGSNQVQLTFGDGENQPSCSSDGQWVVYASGGPASSPEPRRLWKVSINGGEPIQLTDYSSNWGNISPDGSMIASWYKKDNSSPWKIAIIPITGGQPLKVFDVTPRSPLRWMPDGRSITFVKTENEVSNVWAQPLTGEPPKQLTKFTAEEILNFDWSLSNNLICSRGFEARDAVLITNFR